MVDGISGLVAEGFAYGLNWEVIGVYSAGMFG